MILIATEADIPAVGARIDLSLLHLTLPTLGAGVLTYQLQLPITAHRAHFGDRAAEVGKRFPFPALWASVCGLGGRVESSAGRAHSPVAVEADLLRLLSPIHSLTSLLFGFSHKRGVASHAFVDQQHPLKIAKKRGHPRSFAWFSVWACARLCFDCYRLFHLATTLRLILGNLLGLGYRLARHKIRHNHKAITINLKEDWRFWLIHL